MERNHFIDKLDDIQFLLDLTQQFIGQIDPKEKKAEKSTEKYVEKSIQRDALEEIYHSLGGSRWKNSTNWLSDLPISQWFGVKTRLERGQNIVYSLQLQNNNLIGEIPPALGQLINLESLYLEHNTIVGQIPKEISLCQNLQTISLGNNQLKPSIVPEIGLLKNLKTLSLNNNQFQNEIPLELGLLVNLEALMLQNNLLIGNIPVSFSELSKITYLDLSNNQLSGEIQENALITKQLYYLDISNNMFNGFVPGNWRYLANLKKLYIQNNKFSGKLFKLIDKLNDSSIYKDYNVNLYGEITRDFKNKLLLEKTLTGFENLTEIEVSHFFDGCWKNLEIFHLYNNSFTLTDVDELLINKQFTKCKIIFKLEE
ncbi:MAG: hypothetical protein ORN85_08340, partial [Sediminibacterium sp.]|nr:hypothetical protein [Sediminibacterium sp.]